MRALKVGGRLRNWSFAIAKSGSCGSPEAPLPDHKSSGREGRSSEGKRQIPKFSAISSPIPFTAVSTPCIAIGTLILRSLEVDSEQTRGPASGILEFFKAQFRGAFKMCHLIVGICESVGVSNHNYVVYE